MTFFQPTQLPEALDILHRLRPKVLAGGTDVYPALQNTSLQEPVLDISRLKQLSGIEEKDDHWRIGASVTWSALLNADLPRAFDALKQAAREVGSTQIQNRATIVGNLCNASPAADGVPPLLIVDAEIVLQSSSGKRILSLEDFLLGNRRTEKRTDELVIELRIPRSAANGVSRFKKLGARHYLVISIAMVAVKLVFDASERVSNCAISVGACSAVARRLRRLEHAIIGRDRHDLMARPPAIGAEALDVLSPIDDVRATAAYRQDASATLVSRLLQETAMVEP
jgi:CO/xanthine dehydrogenase FAD-binding subunit